MLLNNNSRSFFITQLDTRFPFQVKLLRYTSLSRNLCTLYYRYSKVFSFFFFLLQDDIIVAYSNMSQRLEKRRTHSSGENGSYFFYLKIANFFTPQFIFRFTWWYTIVKLYLSLRNINGRQIGVADGNAKLTGISEG